MPFDDLEVVPARLREGLPGVRTSAAREGETANV
jgi:hypothetical protein